MMMMRERERERERDFSILKQVFFSGVLPVFSYPNRIK
jgi:hypothetical protein